MKYEYLKGSEKDFEGAPEWALFIVSGIASGNLYYLEGMNKGLRYGSMLTGLESTIWDINDNSIIIAERRPITEPSWDGVGLPPVGCYCEYKEVNTSFWIMVNVVFISEWVIVIRDNRHRVDIAFDLVSTRVPELRPIRTEAYKNRDETIDAIALAYDGFDKAGNYRAATGVYEDIAAGKIPGVKLEG